MDNDDTFNGLIFLNKYCIPPEILSLILSNIDTKTLYKHCPLVCKLWNEFIKDFVWKLKCEQQFLNKQQIQLLRQKQYPYNVYQMICVFNKSFYKNLIQNPCGQNAFNKWLIDKNGGDRFIIEDCSLIDSDFCEIQDEMVSSDATKCFTTSYGQCSKLQVIDLYTHFGGGEVIKQFIDEYQPPIYLSEWYGSRRDCGCLYKLIVILFDSKYQPIHRCNCNYLFCYKIEQWQGGFFKKVEYVFKNYGPNVRYIFFYHIGQDTQFWAGHYGSKFTNSNVQLFYPNDTSKDHVIDLHPQDSHHKGCKQINNCKSPIYNFDRTLQVSIKHYKTKYLI